jgi:hypothetical protein
MSDILLLKILKQKGLLSEDEVHSLKKENVISEVYPAVIDHEDTHTISETKARNIVSDMYHIESGKKYVGERFTLCKAKEVAERYRDAIPLGTSIYDVYIAINSQYHNCINLYKHWFDEDIEQKIIESAMNYWFMDDDCKHENKIIHVFM